MPAYPEDRLQIVLPSFAPSLDLWDPGILDGATEGTVVPWPGTTIRTPLLDGAAGDRVHVVQLGRVDGPVAYLTPVRAGVLPETFSVEDGVDQVAQVALGPIARTGTLEVDWAIGEMEALLGEMGPGMYPGQFPSHELTVDALQQGLGPASATLLEVWTGAAADTLHLGPLAYGRPYPDSFEETAWISMTAAMEVTLAVWETNRQTDVTVAASLGPPTPGRMVARPSLSPPHAVRLAGRDVSRTPQLDVGTTPTISWSPPSLGTAALYRVTLYRVITNGPTRTAARFLTTSTQLQIPPGILQADAFHYARLTAFGDGGYAETVTAGFLP